jgi:hypothetical protein
LREALDRYGARKLGINLQGQEDKAETEEGFKNGVEIWVGWDATTEIEMQEGSEGAYIGDEGGRFFVPEDASNRVLAIRKNPYGCVPMIVMLNDHDPESEYGLGDYDRVQGSAELERLLQNIITHQARNGGGQAWFRSEYMDEEQVQMWLDGELDEPLRISGAPGDQALGFTANQALNEVVLKGLDYVSQGRNADQAVDQFQLGIVQDPSSTATAQTLAASRSTARSQLARTDYEGWLELVAYAVVECYLKFGLDPRAGKPSQDDIADYAALKDVRVEDGITVLEESAAFSDPTVERQAAMQLLGVALQAFQATIAEGTPIKISAFITDALNAFNRRDTDKYFMNPQETQAFMQQQAQQQAAAAASKQGPRPQPKSPVETLNYANAPPDIQRQIEAQAGLTPSKEGNTEQNLHEASMQQDKHQQALQVTGMQMQMEREKLLAQQHHEAVMTQAEHAHDQQTQTQQQAHERETQSSQQGTQIALATQQQQAQQQRQTAQPSGGGT